MGRAAPRALRSPSISTAIPPTRLLGLSIAGRTATIDLSDGFTAGGGSSSMQGRIAQVVYTLTRLDGIDGVRFRIDGVPTTVFGGEGVLIGDPAGRFGFDDLLPAIMIESPAYGGFLGNPATVTGIANTFEANVAVTLADSDGLIIFEGFTTATCGTGCFGSFEISFPYAVARPQMGSLIAFEISARDGSQVNIREHPVGLIP